MCVSHSRKRATILVYLQEIIIIGHFFLLFLAVKIYVNLTVLGKWLSLLVLFVLSHEKECLQSSDLTSMGISLFNRNSQMKGSKIILITNHIISAKYFTNYC